MEYYGRGLTFKMWTDNNGYLHVTITCQRGGGGHITIPTSYREPLMRAFNEAVQYLAEKAITKLIRRGKDENR